MEIALSLYKWKVFYADKTCISSSDMSPYSIPYGRREGVQVIVQPDLEHVWCTLSGYDYYIWDTWEPEKAAWHGVDREGYSYYMRNPGFRCVLFGTFISKHRFREIFNMAKEELDSKTGYGTTERKP